MTSRRSFSGHFSPRRQGVTMLRLCSALPALLWASLSVLSAEGDSNASKICKPAPYWDVEGHVPMQEHLGNVVVVALLKAT